MGLTINVVDTDNRPLSGYTVDVTWYSGSSTGKTSSAGQVFFEEFNGGTVERISSYGKSLLPRAQEFDNGETITVTYK